jgi:hypothetical protein
VRVLHVDTPAGAIKPERFLSAYQGKQFRAAAFRTLERLRAATSCAERNGGRVLAYDLRHYPKLAGEQTMGMIGFEKE